MRGAVVWFVSAPAFCSGAAGRVRSYNGLNRRCPTLHQSKLIRLSDFVVVGFELDVTPIIDDACGELVPRLSSSSMQAYWGRSIRQVWRVNGVEGMQRD